MFSHGGSPAGMLKNLGPGMRDSLGRVSPELNALAGNKQGLEN